MGSSEYLSLRVFLQNGDAWMGEGSSLLAQELRLGVWAHQCICQNILCPHTTSCLGLRAWCTCCHSGNGPPSTTHACPSCWPA